MSTMARKEDRLQYALSFKGKGMENEELKETIRLAILDGAVWADRTMIDKACEWLQRNFNMPDDFELHFRKAMEN